MSAHPDLDLTSPSHREFSRANYHVYRYSTDLSDEEWSLVSPLLPPQKPPTGRPALDHRTVVNAILWVTCTGNSWRSLPARYGKWTTASSRYHRWLQAGIWNQVVEALLANATAVSRSRAHLAPPAGLPSRLGEGSHDA